MANSTKHITVLHCYGTHEGKNNDKVYVATIDLIGPGEYRVNGYWGARTKERLTLDPKGTYTTLDQAESARRELIMSKVKKYYVDIEFGMYMSSMAGSSARLTMNQALEKIDTSRIVGYNTSSPQQGALPAAPAQPKPKKRSNKPEESRVERSIDF